MKIKKLNLFYPVIFNPLLLLVLSVYTIIALCFSWISIKSETSNYVLTVDKVKYKKNIKHFIEEWLNAIINTYYFDESYTRILVSYYIFPIFPYYKKDSKIYLIEIEKLYNRVQYWKNYRKEYNNK